MNILLCVNNDGYTTSLEVRKAYKRIEDQSAATAGLVRVVDESGGEGLYAAELFAPVELPQDVALELFGGTNNVPYRGELYRESSGKWAWVVYVDDEAYFEGSGYESTEEADKAMAEQLADLVYAHGQISGTLPKIGWTRRRPALTLVQGRNSGDASLAPKRP